MRTFRIGFGLFLFAGASYAQQYVISTIAGGAPPPTPVAALTASIPGPSGPATDSVGNVYFASNYCIFKLDPNGNLIRLAGTSRRGYSGDGGLATSAELGFPQSVALDSSGDLFFADGQRIRKISPTGLIITVAGNGVYGTIGDGGPAVNSQLMDTGGIALDESGNLFIADGPRVRKVSTNGIITTVAGNGTYGFSGDSGPALSAQLQTTSAIAVDALGNIFVFDSGNVRIRKVSTDGVITTVAGGGSVYPGDGGPATSALLNDSLTSYGIAVDGNGNLFIADGGTYLREVSNGIIRTVAGNGTSGFSGDGGPAISAQVRPVGVAVDGSGNLFIAEGDNSNGDTGEVNRVRKISTNGIITTVAGNGTRSSGDGGPAINAYLSIPMSVASDGLGNLFIADSHNYRVRKISTSGIITTIAGNGILGYSGDGGSATSAQLSPSGVAADGTGNVFVVDSGSTIRKVSSGIITRVAGTGNAGFSGDGGPAISATFENLSGVTIDASGNLFLVDSGNNRIRKVSTAGIIITVAGNGTQGFSGDAGPATSAELSGPSGVAVDGSGNLFIADYGNNRIRKVSTVGIITTVAGNGTLGFSGDGGPATSAELSDPSGVAVDGSGNLFIADFNRIREVSARGIITTVAGNGTQGFSGDGGFATVAPLGAYLDVAVDVSGNVYIADQDNNAIRMLTPTNQSVLISAVFDAASESDIPVSPGKIIVIYGGGMGPATGVTATPSNGAFGTQLSGTTVSVNGVAAPVYYTSATQVNAIVPYATAGTAANISVSYQGGLSSAFSAPIAASSPSLFSYNVTGAGQAVAINVVDGTLNTAANPVKIGAYISFYATGEGQTTPAGVDGKLAVAPLPSPNLPVAATVGGLPAVVQYKGGVSGTVAGLMQINVQIPSGVTPGGYVPVVLTVGNASTVNGAIWIAVSN